MSQPVRYKVDGRNAGRARLQTSRQQYRWGVTKRELEIQDELWMNKNEIKTELTAACTGPRKGRAGRGRVGGARSDGGKGATV